MRIKIKLGYRGGFSEVASGVVESNITEKTFFGTRSRDSMRSSYPEQINNNNDLTNLFEVYVNSYLLENYHDLLYVVWKGKKWAIKHVEVNRPRLIIRAGGDYVEPTS